MITFKPGGDKQMFHEDHRVCASSPRKGRLLKARDNPTDICPEFYVGDTSQHLVRFWEISQLSHKGRTWGFDRFRNLLKVEQLETARYLSNSWVYVLSLWDFALSSVAVFFKFHIS